MILLELAETIGLSPKCEASTQGGEYSSACPKCGGKDRFRLQPNKQQKNCFGYYFCRQCGVKGDAIQFCREFLGYSFQDAVTRVGANIDQIPIPKTVFQKSLYKNKNHKAFEVTLPPIEWVMRANRFTDWAHDKLLQCAYGLHYLKQRGLPLKAVEQYKLGLCPEELFESRSTWGLPEQYNEKGSLKKIWLPEGIVIPTGNPNLDVIRIKIRRSIYHEDDEYSKYVAVPESANGLNIIGDKSLNTMIVVESELDAYALHYAIGDLAIVIAAGSALKEPDNVTDYLAKRVTNLLICHDNDDAGKKMFDKWYGSYPHSKAYSTPIGKDIGEAIEQGLNLRNWILKAT